MTTTSARSVAGARPTRLGLSGRLDRLSDERFGAILATPGLLLVGLFVVPPVLAVLVLSLFRVELSHDSFLPFVALRNYAVRLGNDSTFLFSLPLTIGFAVVVTAIAVPVGLWAALTIHGRSRRTAGVLGLLLLLPWAVAPIADGVFWRLMFSGDGHLTQLLRALGLPTVVLREAPGILVATLVAVVWRAIPLLGVLFLGALRQVPPEIQRAARVDGATPWQTFRHVTLPAIFPSVVAACLIQVVLTLQVFEIQFAISGDQPREGSILAAFSIYRTVIADLSLGYGAATTVVLGVVIALCLLLLHRFVIRPAWLGVPGREIADDSAVAFHLPAGDPRSTAIDEPWEAAPVAAPAPLRRAAETVGRSARRVASAATALLLALWLVGPIAWVLVVSTQSRLIQSSPPRLTAPTLLAFERLVTTPAWQAAATVSVTVTVIATGLALVIATLAAYPLARYRWRGGRPLLAFLLATQLIPPIALAIPVLFLFAGLGLRNTIAGLVLVNVCFWTPVLVWLVRSAFLGVPANLERAARIDGSSRLGAIFRITLPAAAPAVAAAAAIVFIGIWNDFVFVALMGGRDTSTLPRYLVQSFTPAYVALSATIIVTVAPCVALVLLLRRRILQLV